MRLITRPGLRAIGELDPRMAIAGVSIGAGQSTSDAAAVGSVNRLRDAVGTRGLLTCRSFHDLTWFLTHTIGTPRQMPISEPRAGYVRTAPVTTLRGRQARAEEALRSCADE